jgi:hypothetical protein
MLQSPTTYKKQYVRENFLRRWEKGMRKPKKMKIGGGRRKEQDNLTVIRQWKAYRPSAGPTQA